MAQLGARIAITALPTANIASTNVAPQLRPVAVATASSTQTIEATTHPILAFSVSRWLI